MTLCKHLVSNNAHGYQCFSAADRFSSRTRIAQHKHCGRTLPSHALCFPRQSNPQLHASSEFTGSTTLKLAAINVSPPDPATLTVDPTRGLPSCRNLFSMGKASFSKVGHLARLILCDFLQANDLLLIEIACTGSFKSYCTSETDVILHHGFTPTAGTTYRIRILQSLPAVKRRTKTKSKTRCA